MKNRLTSTFRHQTLRAATLAYKNFRLSDSPRDGLRILMYHSIGTAIEGDKRGLYNMEAVQFKRHMKYLVSHYDQQLVPLSLDSLTKRALRIVLTFDDGYQDNLKVAAPLLVDLGIPFTVFVCTDPVAQRKSGFLCPEEVQELASLPGVQIGSHSASHAKLTRCNDLQLHQELAGSKSYLEDLIGRPICTLSYPHGDINRRVRDVAEKVGYVIGCTSRFDINAESRDPLLLCRSDMWAKDTVSVFEEKLQGDWDWNRWRTADPACPF